MPLWLGMTSKVSVGSIAGYMAGNFIKQITDRAIFFMGIGVLMVGGLHLMQWITINFKKIDEDLLHLVQRARNSAQDNGLVQRIKRMLIRTAPLLVGFGAGIYYGFEHA